MGDLNGKIYILECNITHKIYIGSTLSKYLSTRLNGHKHKYQEFLVTKKLFCASFDIIKNGDYKITILEEYPCKSKTELRIREQFYLDANPSCINQRRAFNTVEQNKEAVRLATKRWVENHPEEVKKYYKPKKNINITTVITV